VAATGGVAVAEPDVAKPTETPMTADISAAATAIHRRLLFARNLRTLGRRAGFALGAAVGSGVALDSGGPEGVSLGAVGSKSLMRILLLLG
jgi:hypothetical protein